jgi:hypothetical protein
MIEHTLDTANSILYLRPKSALEQSDFTQLASAIDPHIEKIGGLAGLVIEVSAFPGWENIGALVAHIRFVQDHHKRIKKVALVTDSAIGNVAQLVASHFVAAKIRHFPAGKFDDAKQWIMERT